MSKKEAIGFCCHRRSDGSGYTPWTLTTQLGALLRDAEAQFGPRDKDWTPLGIEFNGRIPKVWYPGNCGHISILLTDAARLNPALALFELAHEVVHLLAPSGGGPAPVIEEGVPTLFAHTVSANYGLGFRAHGAEYLSAEAEVNKLLDQSPGAILQLRKRERAFHRFTPDLVTATLPNVPADLARSLCRTFSRSSPVWG